MNLTDMRVASVRADVTRSNTRRERMASGVSAEAARSGNCFRLLAGAAILVSELASGCTTRCTYFGETSISCDFPETLHLPVKSTSIQDVGTGGQRL